MRISVSARNNYDRTGSFEIYSKHYKPGFGTITAKKLL